MVSMMQRSRDHFAPHFGRTLPQLDRQCRVEHAHERMRRGSVLTTSPLSFFSDAMTVVTSYDTFVSMLGTTSW